MDGIEYCDFIDAEPPPRELGGTAKRYVRVMSTYFWLGMMIFFVTLPGALVAVIVPRVDTVVWAIGMAGLTVWLARATARKRRRLRLVAIEGVQAPARVVDAHELVVRRGLLARTRVTLVLEVEGRRVTCRSWAGDFEGLTRGHWMRVLTHGEVPELVIPVASVT
ncbi:MAG TPA: hypothetical protein VL463_25920 [Kofleriaceae bacterium]|nr:hypothetical protein [Kofleriaceae bacterium]